MECSSDDSILQSIDFKSRFIAFSDEINTVLSSLNEKGNDLLKDLRRLSNEFTEMAKWVSTYHLTRLLNPYTQNCNDIFKAVGHLSSKRTGALMVIQREDPLDERITAGISLFAEISSSLLESLFIEGNPLHDGAIVIQNDRIISAANVLPLTKKAYKNRKMGTRHRAAIGLSEQSDALIFVVSEETGKKSFAFGGALYPLYLMKRKEPDIP